METMELAGKKFKTTILKVFEVLMKRMDIVSKLEAPLRIAY